MPTVLGEFEQLLLLALMRLGADAYGVTIRQEIQRVTGRDVSAGAVYTALGRLEQRALVSSKAGESAAERTGMRRRYYKIEPEGARRLSRAFHEMQAMADGLVPELARMAPRKAGKRG